MRFAAIGDYREQARRRLPHFLFEYVDGGAFAEVTLRQNRADLEGVTLRQRVLRDVSGLDLSTVLFGQELSMPVALAPIGLAGLAARRGEVQAAQAAEAAGVPLCLSTLSLCPLAEVARGVTRPFWFQLYMIRDRELMVSLLSEAEQRKCSALIFTVDMPVPGTRYRDYRSGLAGAPGLRGAARRMLQALGRPAWALDVGLRGGPHCLGNMVSVLGANSGLDDYFAWMRGNFDPTVAWKDLEWVRARWKGPLILKGILDVEDAREAARLGVDGIVVSNHGGRQLDGVASTACALPNIADAVGQQLTVLVDGGVRSGLDVVRMLALGAKGVLLGRAWAYALAARGRLGVQHVLELIAAEMKVAMSLTGAVTVKQITRDILDTSRP
jgi:L-lactate dehydrogenase (cytochrome)